jgi:UDPglucose--hexose-1-phosphate uridylyltransferase
MRRTMTDLADGREIFYYDQADRISPPPRDTRDIEPVAVAGEIRYDALFDEWVAVAGHRQTRTFLPSASTCPLCPSSDSNLTEVPAASYDVVVFQNRYPSFTAPPDGWDLPPSGVQVSTAAAGRCEVMCFSDDHLASFSTLSPERVRLVIDAWADRTTELSRLPFTALVFPFENCGEEIGVTISHPHGQIYAYPFIPPRAATMLRASQQHHDATGRHLLDDLVEAEVADGSRVVASTARWVAFVPYAARWPYQVQIHPRRHVGDIPELDGAERDDLARVYLDVLRRFNGLFGLKMPYIAAWHQAPVGELRRFGRLHLDLFTSRRAPDKLKYLAGSEAAMGAFVNDISPEDAARSLREVTT